MKDFIKWLGVNEKIAKLAVWMLIIMVFLIIFNTGLESLGFPHYQITYKNLVKINPNKLLDIIMSCAICILNFYTMILLVFRVKEAKRIFKYSLIYMILNWLVNILFNYAILQIFIFVYCIIFCYYYSKRNWKYSIYFIGSYVFTIIIQGVWYLAKARFIDYTAISSVTKSLLSLDYFIIMGLIILVKEIYLKKRGEIKWEMDQDVSYGSANSKTKENSLKKSQKN